MAVFTNRAILTYNGAQTLSNTVTGEIVGVLSVYKEAVPDTYSEGSEVTYAVSLVNSGSAPLSGLTVEDDLGAYDEAGETYVPLTYIEGSARLFISGVPADAPQAAAGPGLVFTGISVPGNGDALLLYDVLVNGFAPMAAGSGVTNTVTASGSGITGAEASAIITAEVGPELSVIKSVSPSTVMENGRLTYTFVIENYGNAAAEGSDLVLSDVFSPVLSDIAATLDGSPLEAGTGYSYNALTGAFSTLPGVITVPAASFSRSADGTIAAAPGRATLTVSGNV